jgi:hypothetical protein
MAALGWLLNLGFAGSPAAALTIDGVQANAQATARASVTALGTIRSGAQASARASAFVQPAIAAHGIATGGVAQVGDGVIFVSSSAQAKTFAFGSAAWDLADLEQQMLDDLDIFFDVALQDFGESLSFGAVALVGIFNKDSYEGGDLGGPRVLLKTADIDAHGIDQGTVLAIRGIDYAVVGVQRDGVGVSTIVLNEEN